MFYKCAKLNATTNREWEVKMRRSDREVKDFEDIVAIMEKCDVCRIALNNNGYPYIVPLNFGMCIKENKIELVNFTNYK